MSENPADVAHQIRGPVQVWGGKFMTSAAMHARGEAHGLPKGALYFRGRSAVLGDPPAEVVTALFGLFPAWLPQAVLPAANSALSANAAVRAYAEVCWEVAREHLADVADPAGLADLLCTVIDDADASGLALFAGWRAADRPEDPPARLGHALMLFRELRGGLHFAALRASGLSVTEAVVADPEGGRERMLRTGWRPEDADAAIARAEERPDLAERWQRAERLTDERTGDALATALTAEQLADLRTRLLALP